MDQKTRTTIPGSDCQDEGYFSGYGTLMILWPGDSYNIVRRYDPALDTDGDGTADAKDPDGYPHLVNRIYLKSLWSSSNGAAGFPLNLKTETRFNEFVARLEGRGTGEQCIFDLNGCNLCTEYEEDEHGNETDVCKTWEVQTDEAIPDGEHCPDSFYTSNICTGSGPDEDNSGQACDSWYTSNWKPAEDEKCQGTDFIQERKVEMRPTGCDASLGTPSTPEPDDEQTATGTQPLATCCTDWTSPFADSTVPGNPAEGWRRGWKGLGTTSSTRNDYYECQQITYSRKCKSASNWDSKTKTVNGLKPEPAWSGDLSNACTTQDVNQTRTFTFIADYTREVQDNCPTSRTVPGTRTCNPVDGVCGATTNTCKEGTLDSASVSTGPPATWTCAGEKGGAPSGTCTYNPPVDGVCDNKNKHQCLAGTALNTYGNTWTCKGQNGGKDDACRYKPPRPITNTCALQSFSKTYACGQTTIDCTQTYEKNYEYCRVTNPSPGASYWYTPHTGYQVLFTGGISVSYQCCTNCTTETESDACNWTPSAVNTRDTCGPAPSGGPNPVDNPYTDCAVTAITRNWQRCKGQPLTDIPSACAALPQVCGTQDNTASGCTTGQYRNVPGPTWACDNAVNFNSGGITITNAICPMP